MKGKIITIAILFLTGCVMSPFPIGNKITVTKIKIEKNKTKTIFRPEKTA